MACPATAMKMKTLIRSILLLVSVWTRLHLLVAGDDPAHPIWDVCQNTEYRNGSDFQRNLNQVLESLVGNASTSGFITRVEGQDSDSTVYGFFQCRGDLNSSDCKHCASTANARLRNRCNRTSGLVQPEDCFLRYDNHSFYNVYNESSEIKFCNPTLITSDKFINSIGRALSEIIEKAVQSPKLFATYKDETGELNVPPIYSLAQCWGNLSQTNCRSCLAAARSNIAGPAGCRTGAVGGRYLSPNCVLRYEIGPFFNTSIIKPPPPPPQRPT